MRHFFPIFIIALALYIGAAGYAPAAYAAGTLDLSTPAIGTSGAQSYAPDTSSLGTGSGVTTPAPASTGVNYDVTAGTGLVGNTGAQTYAPSLDPSKPAASSVQTDTPGKATVTGGTQDKEDEAYSGIMIKIMTLFAWLVGVAMITLNFAVYYTVIIMGAYVKNLSSVGLVWTVLRDIGNIALIFGFLAIGITTILNVDWYGDRKKMLPMLLVAAVFLNFSLFFSEAVVDVGNLFATQFYQQINGDTLPTPATLGDEGISGKIMSQMGIQTIYGRMGDATTAKTVLNNGSPWVIGFMSILLFIVLAFVLFSLAFIFIARFVILLFLIILSPVGFAGYAIPMLKGKSKQWFDLLVQQTITAPVLLLLLYIALRVITDAQFLTGLGGTGGDWLGTMTGDPTGIVKFAPVFLSFLVAMGLLIAVTIVAKRLSAFGAGHATAAAGALTFGATAWGMNKTVGRSAYRINRGARQSKTFNKINAMTGSVMTKTLDKAAKGSFDLRASRAVGGLASVGLGLDAGKATSGGFAGARTQNIKAREDEAKRIEDAHKEAFRGNTEEDKKAIEQASADLKRAAEGMNETKKEYEEKKRETEGHKEKIKMIEKETGTDPDKVTRLADARGKLDAHAAEVKRIEEEKIITPDKAKRLAEARGKLDASTADIKELEKENDTALIDKAKRLAEARKDLDESVQKQDSLKRDLGMLGDIVKNLGKVEETAKGAAEARMGKSIEESKIAYAEGIDHPLNPIALVSYGPGTSTAARNIIKSATKKEDPLDKAIKAAIKKEALAAASTAPATPPPPLNKYSPSDGS